MNGQGSSPGGSQNRYYGKYRGTVTQNVDPQQIGRTQVQVPDVLGGSASSWAMPCVPAGGPQAGCFIVPPVGSQVWVEFEQGDPDYPIWCGGFWGSSGDLPSMALTPAPASSSGQNIAIQTTSGNMVVVSDASGSSSSGGIVLKSASGAVIVVNESGIYIDNGQGATITLSGSSVDINNGGLTVT